MAYDLVIKNGMVIDGSGLPRYRADVGVRHGRIVTIGRICERAREVVDAEGQVVAPGFVDGHTHLDAQIFWDPLGTSSCWHGITSVVMGNCGFTLAPCAAADRHLVVRNLQRAEDIPPEAMAACAHFPSPSSGGSCAIRTSAGAWSRPPVSATAAGRWAPRPGPRTTTGCSCSTPWRGRTARWPRSPASAARTPWRP